MSKDLNKVQLTGRLGKDPEVSVTTNGTTRTTFSLATNRTWKDGDGQIREETQWTPIIAWAQLGEICGEYLHTGSWVYIEGRLQTRSWEDAESGQKRYMTEVVASEMIMLDKKGDTDDADAPEPEPTPSPTTRRRTYAAADVL